MGFDLTCDECVVTVAITLEDDRWRERLAEFAGAHGAHRHIFEIPEPRQAM